MERRVFLAIFLAAVVMYGWQALFVPPQPPVDTAKPPAAAAGSATPGQEASAPATPAAAAAQPAPAAPAADALVTDSTEREIIVETSTVQAVLSNRGGRILHWRLKEYRDAQGNPVDLVPTNLPATEPTPFSLQADDPELTRRLNAAIYRTTGDRDGRLDATQSAGTIVFEYQEASGLQVRKEFKFDPSSYVVTFSANAATGTQPINLAIQWGPGLGDIGATSGGGSFFTGNYVQPPQAIYHLNSDVERLNPDDVAAQPAHEGQFRFAGV